MKSFLSKIFNFFKSIILIVGIIAIGFLVISILNPYEMKVWNNIIWEKMGIVDATEDTISLSEDSEFEEEYIEPFASNEDLIAITEYDGRTKRKIKITTQQGDIFIRYSSIVFVEKKNSILKLVTNKAKEYTIHERTQSLSGLFEYLDNETTFFKLKSSIINCHYIEMIESIHSSKYIVMENNKKFSLPDAKVNDLIEHLENKCF